MNTPSTQLSQLFVLPIQWSSYCPVLLHWYVSLSFPSFSFFLSSWLFLDGAECVVMVIPICPRCECVMSYLRQCDCVPETSILPAKQHTHTHTHTHIHMHTLFLLVMLNNLHLSPLLDWGHTHTYMLSHCLSLKCWTAHTYTRQRAGNAHTHTHTHTDWLIWIKHLVVFLERSSLSLTLAAVMCIVLWWAFVSVLPWYALAFSWRWVDFDLITGPSINSHPFVCFWCVIMYSESQLT